MLNPVWQNDRLAQDDHDGYPKPKCTPSWLANSEAVGVPVCNHMHGAVSLHVSQMNGDHRKIKTDSSNHIYLPVALGAHHPLEAAAHG